MNYLTLENISKSYGEKLLFTDLSLRINQGDRIAIIARNGSGKSTLLRMIAGIEPPEGVNPLRQLASGIRVGYLMQEPVFDTEGDIFTYAIDIDQPRFAALRSLREAQNSNDEKAMQNATSLMDDAHGWDTESVVMQMLHQFGLHDTGQLMHTLSGGQKKRLALARLLLEDPDLLILDEPTNHLDIHSIEWLEEALANPQHAVLMVTHDRYFLNRVCNEICEIHNGNLVRYRGNYADYLEKKTLLSDMENVRHDKTRKLMRQELEWVRRMPKARTTKAKSRIQQFEEIREAVAQRKEEETIQIEIEMTRLGSKIVEMHNAGFSFGDDRKILEKFNYKFKKGDRIGLVGPNGSGKTTFARLLTGDLHVHSGKIIIGETVRFGYYRQEGFQPPGDLRVIDVVRNIAEYLPLKGGRKLTAEQLLERFLFPRPQQQVFYSQLSGGERRRLYLLTILMGNPNFLIFDEPTNDLDIITLNILEDFLLDFAGCLLIITHDRFILDKLVDHLFVMNGSGTIRDFPGTYAQFAALREDQHEYTTESKATEVSDAAKAYEQRRQLKKLEREIKKLEQRKSQIAERMYASGLSLEEIQNLSDDLDSVMTLIGIREAEWLDLAGELP